jgi:hypothetical protein
MVTQNLQSPAPIAARGLRPKVIQIGGTARFANVEAGSLTVMGS